MVEKKLCPQKIKFWPNYRHSRRFFKLRKDTAGIDMGPCPGNENCWEFVEENNRCKMVNISYCYTTEFSMDGMTGPVIFWSEYVTELNIFIFVVTLIEWMSRSDKIAANSLKSWIPKLTFDALFFFDLLSLYFPRSGRRTALGYRRWR